MHPYEAVVKVLLSELDQKVIQNGAKIHPKSIKQWSKKPSEKHIEKNTKNLPKWPPKWSQKGAKRVNTQNRKR